MYAKNKVIRLLERASNPVRRIWSRLPEALIGLVSLLFILFCLLTYFPSIGNYASKLATGNKYLALAEGLLNPFRTRNILLKSGLEIYDLSIGRQQYAILENVADKARKQGWMSDDLKVWVNGKFIHGGQKYDVKVRLRGDLPNHWSGKKKSWRIKFVRQRLNDNGTMINERIFFQGQRQINLIVPNDREYILGYFVNALMREAGLLVPRDRFVILRLNGTLQGLYYQVEHFDKPLLAANRKPDSTVFAQSDRVMHFEKYTKYGIPTTSDARFDLGSVKSMVAPGNPLALRAMQVLLDHSLHPTKENFRRVLQVLDWDKYLRFRVITTLCNTNHVRFGSDNFRLYYDPSRGLLEPVPWDVHLTRLPREPGTIDFWNSHGPDEIQRATLEDPHLRWQRNKILWEMVQDDGKKLMAQFNEMYDRLRPVIWADVLATPVQGYKIDRIQAELKYNVKRVAKVLGFSSANLLYRLERDNLAVLEFTALNFSGIKLGDLKVEDSGLFKGDYFLYEDTNNNNMLDEADTLKGKTTAQHGSLDFLLDHTIFPEVVYGSDFIDGGRYWEFYKTLSGKYRLFLVGTLAAAKRDILQWQPPNISVQAENAVTGQGISSSFPSQSDPSEVGSLGITAYDASAPFDLEAPNYSQERFLSEHPEFLASQEHPGAVELSGQVTLRNTIMVPKGVSLILRPGADITMEGRANIICYGGLISLGTPESPVRVHGNDMREMWGTFAVIRPPTKVTLKYTEFADGGQALVNGMLFTGGFAVYDGDLELDHCRFVNMQSEDAVNLKNGTILMKHSLFSENRSDGIDIDFGTGEVKDCQFTSIGGDGIDLSGSKVTIIGCLFREVGDKGISVGEDSHPIIVNNLFHGNAIGISTKDLSYAKVANCTFLGNRVAIEAKRKKAMFGGGAGEFVNCVFSKNDQLLKEDYFSKGRVNIGSSLVDDVVDRRNGDPVNIRFVAPSEGNYVLSPSLLNTKPIELSFPGWLQENAKEENENANRISSPGIYSALGPSENRFN